MEEQPKDIGDMTGAELARDEQAQLMHEVEAWIESKGISTTCPLCGKENAWDVPDAELINPLAAGTSIRMSSDPKHQPSPAGDRNRRDPIAAHGWSLGRIRDAVRGNMRRSRLVKLTCSNCRYALLLDHVKIREETEANENL